MKAKSPQKPDDPGYSPDERALFRCKVAKELEASGDYEGARAALGELWGRVGERPALEGLSQATVAELLLVVGRLTGSIGSARQIAGAQEAAKDLIGESITTFGSLQDGAKVAEALADLAECYWREGAFDEARILLKDALDKIADSEVELKASTLLRRAMIERSANRSNDALRILSGAEPLFAKVSNQPLKGRFHSQLGLLLQDIGSMERHEDYLDRAMIEYAAASFLFEQAGHTRYRARVENNLGFLLTNVGRYAEAHKHLDCARRLFAKLKDSGSVAQVDGKRAGTLITEGRFVEAERIARSAVRVLEKGDEVLFVAEALRTHGIALARLGRYEASRRTLLRAAEMAEQVGDLEGTGQAALCIIEELAQYLTPEELRAMYRRADNLLSLSLDPNTLQRLRSCARRVLLATLEDKGAEGAKPFYSCFISYSHKDAEFAERLCSRLQSTGVSVWFAPKDVKGGLKLVEQIEDGIQKNEKLLIVLSKSSLQSEWVKKELREARKAERRTNRRKLFPIRLTSMSAINSWNCFDFEGDRDLAAELREYFIPDFSHWRDPVAFEKAFNRLIESLRSSEADTTDPIPMK